MRLSRLLALAAVFLAATAVACGGKLAEDTFAQAGGSAGAGAAGPGGAAGGPGGGPGGAAGQSQACGLAPQGGCSLKLLGSAALPAPAAGARVGGPSVVAAGSGFIVGYFEITPDGATRTVKIARFGGDGCGGVVSEALFSDDLGIGECPGKAHQGSEVSLGGDFSPALQEGLFGFARVSCPEKDRGAGLGLVRFREDGSIPKEKGDSGFTSTDMASPLGELSLSPQGSIVRGFDAEKFRVIYTNDSRVESFALSKTGPADQLNFETPFDPEGKNSFLAKAAVAASEGAFWAEAAAGEVGGEAKTLLRVSRQGVEKRVELPAASSLALRLVADSRVLLVSRRPLSSDSAMTSAGWTLMDSSGNVVFPAGGFSQLGLQFAGFDVAVDGEKAIFVASKGGALLLRAVRGLGGAPPFQTGDDLVLEPQDIPALKGLSGAVAAAASKSRVAVAWVTGEVSSAGGVAVFECE